MKNDPTSGLFGKLVFLFLEIDLVIALLLFVGGISSVTFMDGKIADAMASLTKIFSNGALRFRIPSIPMVKVSAVSGVGGDILAVLQQIGNFFIQVGNLLVFVINAVVSVVQFVVGLFSWFVFSLIGAFGGTPVIPSI